MNKYLFLAFTVLSLFSSCDLIRNGNTTKNLNLAKVIPEIIAGKDTTDQKLLILRDKIFPAADNPNSILIDTITVKRFKYYTVLAEYPNPIYNRFVILDSDYNVLLLDKSLNGNLTQVPIINNGKQFIKVGENFISKGILELKRLSLYSIDDNGDAELAFRSFIMLKEPGAIYNQEILQIDQKEIRTNINNSGSGKLITEQDTFLFDNSTKRYLSKKTVFDSLVTSEIDKINSETDKPQIIDRNSLLKQMGVVIKDKTTEHKMGNFSLPLTSEWNEVDNVKIISLLRKPMDGTKFINNHYGAEISIIRIPQNSSTENLIKYPLGNVSSGNYTVRFSEKISGGKYFYQFFEYSCENEKYLLILQTLKTTYDTYKMDYQNLINSFSMDC